MTTGDACVRRKGHRRIGRINHLTERNADACLTQQLFSLMLGQPLARF